MRKIMPDGPKPTRKIDFDDFQPTPSGDDDEPYFTRADDNILMDMKDEIIHAANEKAVYKKIQRQVRLECRRTLIGLRMHGLTGGYAVSAPQRHTMAE